jgi:flotillin
MFVATIVTAMARYKRCPSNKILVKYGRIGGGKSALPIHGGATFVWPLLQDFEFLDLAPITTDIALRGALSKQNIRVNVPSRFTFGIGTTPELMQAASERLLGMSPDQIEETARDIIFGQLRATIATMDIEEINADREIFEQRVMNNIETELTKVGLKLINVNISDITDESGYLEALGQRAAAEAVNQAKVDVAERDRDGESGAAEAKQQERVNVADANAKAVTGENTAAVVEAKSDAERKVAEAEARRKGDAATAVKDAEALKEGYEAEKTAEETRAERDRATQTADVVVPAEIDKQKVVIDAEAAKQQEVLAGQARGEAIQAELEGQAKGLKAIVDAAGGDPDKAAMLMIVDKLETIAKLQAEAISNIEFEKVVVFDGGASDGGANTTANWLSGITKILPGLHEFATMAGMTLPEMLGTKLEDTDTVHAEQSAVPQPAGSEVETTDNEKLIPLDGEK